LQGHFKFHDDNIAMQTTTSKLLKDQKGEAALDVEKDAKSIHYIDPLMPRDITLADVLGYCEILGENGFALPISSIRIQRFSRGSSEFLLLLATGRMLGLTSRADNRLTLTPLGMSFLIAGFPEKMTMLGARLTTIESFKSALELLSERKTISSIDVARRVSTKYAMGEFDPKVTNLVLVEWGIPAGLFQLNKEAKFCLLHSRPAEKIVSLNLGSDLAP
jgi:hypothetical protein